MIWNYSSKNKERSKMDRKGAKPTELVHRMVS
jgi:hypothetical protein